MSSDYRPISGRRKLLILLLAIATAIAVVLTLLDPPGGVKRQPPPPRADRPACAAGQTENCVGGMSGVLAAPAAAAASR